MGARVAVVTDSTAYLPAGLLAKRAVGVVALQVVLGGRVGAEGVDVGPQQLAAALREGRRTPVSTSRPCPQAFTAAYEAAARDGAQAVVSVHLSGALSGTVDAARLGAADARLPVRVVDARSTAMGLGFPVLAAAEAAAAGGDVEQVVAAAVRAAARTETLFYVDSLEHLRRGGRIGTAAALVGSALAVKPILRVRDGRIVAEEKLRTASRALGRLEDLAVLAAAGRPVEAAVHHLAAEERADALATRLRSRLPGLRGLLVVEVGAVVGAHVGPGLLGVVVHRL